MTIRRQHKNGLHLIECAICGETKWSNMIKLTEKTQLPVCIQHAEENYQEARHTVPVQRVPHPSNEPADKFKTFSTPDE